MKQVAQRCKNLPEATTSIDSITILVSFACSRNLNSKMMTSQLIKVLAYLIAIVELQATFGEARNYSKYIYFQNCIKLMFFIFFCTENAQGCSISGNIRNGYITKNQMSEIHGSNQTVGNLDEVRYGCVAGYTLIGNKRNICVNGKWMNHQPNCELLCNPKGIISPTFIANCYKQENNIRKYVSCTEPVKPGTIAQINCQQGYENRKIGQQITTCGNNGHWYPPPMPCAQICGEEGPEGDAYIVGGVVTNLTKVPWNVGIYHKPMNKPSFQQICGGTIVNAKIVISAMHCFWDRTEGKPYEISAYRVVAGKYFRELESRENQQTQTRHIIRLLHMDGYNDYRGLYENDIAILVLNAHFDFDPHISPACLDYATTMVHEAVSTNSYGRAAGWGLESSNGLPSPVLKLIELPVVSREECIAKSNPTFVPFITADKFCAGYLTGLSVCQGDSGAGLLFEQNINGKKKFYLRGIVSTGTNKDGSCDNNKYTTFTNVAHFIEFIKSYEIPYRPEFGDIKNVTTNVLFTEVESSSCTISEIPINGFVSLSTAPGDFLNFGETVGNQQLIEYTCIVNLTLIGSSRNICFKGEWISEIPTCTMGSLSPQNIRSNIPFFVTNLPLFITT